MPRRCLPGCECKRHSLRNSGQFQRTATQNSQIRQFWEYVDKQEKHWIWTGPVNENGYGRFTIWGLFDNDNQKMAHVIAFVLAGGVVDQAKQLDHTCKIRSCVNPDCLEQVEPVINIRRSSAAKLNALEVAIIRKMRKNGYKCIDLAEQFGVHQSQISRITTGKRWN